MANTKSLLLWIGHTVLCNIGPTTQRWRHMGLPGCCARVWRLRTLVSDPERRNGRGMERCIQEGCRACRANDLGGEGEHNNWHWLEYGHVRWQHRACRSPWIPESVSAGRPAWFALCGQCYSVASRYHCWCDVEQGADVRAR